MFTNNADADAARSGRTRRALPFEELLPVGGGVRQHRHAMNGSVFKLNDVRDPIAVRRRAAGYRELLIARAGMRTPRPLVDPDGNVVTLVPPGSRT